MKPIKDRKKGAPAFKRTPQRRAILEYLIGNTAHPSAEDVYRAVCEKYHSLSFATVYNTLNFLVKTGAVRELTIDSGRRRYDPDASMHHHLICISCRKIDDVPGDVPVAIPHSAARNYEIIGSHVEFYGYCSQCRKKKRAAS